jgi:methyl-accepting chemotaxis protein
MSNWIANLPFRHKFALLGVVALMMVAAPSTLVLRESMTTLRGLAQESHGLQPAMSLVKLIKVTQEHRGLSSAVLAGDTSRQATRQERQGMVDKAMAVALKEIDTLEQPELSKAAAVIAQNWREVSTAVAEGKVSARDSVQRHTQLIKSELLFVEDVVGHTGLALDADAECYHLIMAAFRDLPRMTERLGQSRARGTAMLVKKSPTPEDSQALLMLLDGAQMHAVDVFRDIDKADLTHHSGVEALVSAVQAAKEGLVRAKPLIESVAQAEDLSGMDSAAYYASMSEVMKAQFAVSEEVLKRLDVRLNERLSAERRTVLATCVSILLMIAVGAWLAMTITRVTNRAVGRAMQAAQALAQGDFSQTMHTEQRDEIGQMLCAMGDAVANLKHTIGGIKAASESVATASSQIAQGNLDLSARTESQASSLQQTASSMEEMSATVRQNAATAQHANQLATSASSEATHSGDIFKQVVHKMQAIKQSSHKIAEINSVIDGIAFQTNILALNAAVEAARAGEQGRGFAVVAAEVRTLAQRSTQAAREIKSLISSSTESVDAGYNLAEETGHSIERLVSQVKQVSQLMTDIATGSEQQDLGINQVNQAVTQLDEVTQQNAALVEESSAAAASLNDQAVRLQQAVGQFRL